MICKVLEIRDEGTFIAALAVDMNPGKPYPENCSMTEDQFKASLDALYARTRLLRRCGFPCDGRPNILLTHLSADGTPAWNDPYAWGGRTWPVAHHYIINHWHELKDGDVVDVEFILKERPEPKKSERMEGLDV
jgi:hypothetical protein